MKKVLEKPSAEDGDGSLGQSSLRSPSVLLDHSQLLESPLLPEMVVDVFEPRTFNLSSEAVFFSEALIRRPDLPRDGVFQAPELLRDRLQREGGVSSRRAHSSYLLE